jgi:putrescine aminotransferase
VIIPPRTYWPEVQRICCEHDVLLVADEVICGFGRTGNWWGIDTFDIAPDIMPLAKGLSSGYLPIAAVAFHDRMADVLAASGIEYAHGVTYHGHPAAARVALENIHIIEEEGLATRAAGPIGTYLRDRLMTLADHPLVGEVRTCGLLACLELVEDKAARRPYPAARRVGFICREHCFENGLVMRAIRDGMVLSPPLIISEAEIDEIVGKVARALDLTLAQIDG